MSTQLQSRSAEPDKKSTNAGGNGAVARATYTKKGSQNQAEAGLWANRSLIWVMTRRDLMTRYKGSLLGSLWPFIYPLGQLALYTFVFSIILKVRFGGSDSTGNFAMYLMTGLLPWTTFAEAIARSTTVILEVPNLVKRVVFPLETLPLVLVGSTLVSELIGLPVLALISALCYHKVNATLLYVPLILCAQILFTTGLSWFMASLGVYVRDIRHIMALGLSAWMYATPIVYPASAFPENIRFLVQINPMAGIITDLRRTIIDGLAPDWSNFAIYTGISLAFALTGYWFFAKTKRSFADVM